MKKIKKSMLAMAVLVGTCVAPMAALQSFAEEAGELTATEGGGLLRQARPGGTGGEPAGAGEADLKFQVSSFRLNLQRKTTR